MSQKLNEFEKELLEYRGEQYKADKNMVESLLQKVNRPGIHVICEWLDMKQKNGMNFYESPASTKYHGAGIGGLVKHSLRVYDVFQDLLKKYRQNQPYPKEETIILSTLCHDICKVGVYYPQINKSGEYDGRGAFKFNDLLPLGHGEKSVMILQQFIQVTDQEMMLIRYHMGPYDPILKTWGMEDKINEKEPLCFWFYMADHIASKIEGLED